MFRSIFGGGDFSQIMMQLIAHALLIFTALPIHEFAHAFVAHKMGDDTAKFQGRLTLNPFAHLDLIGTISILLVGVGWAKPVPINSYNFKNRKAGMALSSLAGPVANVLLGLVFLILMKLMWIVLSVTGMVGLYPVYQVLGFLASGSVMLGIFNLLPIPPLDGSRILFYFLPEKYYFQIMRYENVIMIVVFVLLFTGVIGRILSPIGSGVLWILDKLTFFLG